MFADKKTILFAIIMSNKQVENQLILGDNLEVLNKLYQDYGEFVDLIYIDLPFFSNWDYEVICGDDEEEVRSFSDSSKCKREGYISWLNKRGQQLYRILKPTGSLYLRFNRHTDVYIRVQILDKVFGKNNFQNDIAWCYHFKFKQKSF